MKTNSLRSRSAHVAFVLCFSISVGLLPVMLAAIQRIGGDDLIVGWLIVVPCVLAVAASAMWLKSRLSLFAPVFWISGGLAGLLIALFILMFVLHFLPFEIFPFTHVLDLSPWPLIQYVFIGVLLFLLVCVAAPLLAVALLGPIVMFVLRVFEDWDWTPDDFFNTDPEKNRFQMGMFWGLVIVALGFLLYILSRR